jgi:integrase
MAITSYSENGKRLFMVYVNGFDSAGRRVQRRKRAIESLRKAETAEFELKRELAQLREEAVPLKWSEWFDEFLNRMRLEVAASTVANYQAQMTKWVHPVWADKEIHTITKGDVYDLVFTKCDGFGSQYTRRNILKMIKRIFSMAVEEGLVDRNPCTGITVRVSEVAQKVLNPTEVKIFLEEAARVQHRFYPVWVTALMTGMRSGELYALKWTDLDFDGRTISVSRAWNSKCGITPTKTRRTRVVPMAEDLVTFLKELKLKADPAGEFILPRLEEWEHGEQARVTRAFCEGLGITSVKFHDLRATFITNLLAAGESLARVMSIVGHSELKTTNGYLRKAGVDVKGGTDKLSYSLPKLGEGKVLQFVDRIE